MLYCIITDKLYAINDDGTLDSAPKIAGQKVVAAYSHYPKESNERALLESILSDAEDWIAFPFAQVAVADVVLNADGQVVKHDFLNQDVAVMMVVDEGAYISVVNKAIVKDSVVRIPADKINDGNLHTWKTKIAEKASDKDAVVVIGVGKTTHQATTGGLMALAKRQGF